jgi:4-amino-4-deoxy-L-arabinose transferase-like glycosyltransferase
VKPPLRQRLRTLTSREHLTALFARLFPRRIDRIMLALVVVAIVSGTVLRIGVIGTNNRISTDEYGYAENAKQILANQRLVTFKWAPGTSLMFAAAAVLRGYSTLAVVTDSRGVAQYSQLMTDLATLALVALVAWILAGPWAALLAATLMATYEPLIDITRTYLSEPLGGLALLAMVVAVCVARRRGLYALLLAGIVAGLAGLVREDLAIAVAVIMVGLLADARRAPRVALARALVYGLAALATVTPFVIYASLREHRFTPIVSAGPNALFIGTYLPGGGNLFFDEEVTHKAVCHRFPKYCHLPPGDAQGLLALVQSWHPGDSEAAAAQAEAFRNLDKYMLGQPIKFAQMLWNKTWSMWSLPWSGGNAGKTGSLVHTTSVLQHQLYSAIAWIGMLLGLALMWRRWAFVVPVLALLSIAWLNSFFSITPRDNVRFMPFVFLYGAVGLVTALRWAATRVRKRGAPPAIA